MNQAIPIRCFVSHRRTDPIFSKSKKKKLLFIACDLFSGRPAAILKSNAEKIRDERSKQTRGVSCKITASLISRRFSTPRGGGYSGIRVTGKEDKACISLPGFARPFFPWTTFAQHNEHHSEDTPEEKGMNFENISWIHNRTNRFEASIKVKIFPLREKRLRDDASIKAEKKISWWLRSSWIFSALFFKMAAGRRI